MFIPVAVLFSDADITLLHRLGDASEYTGGWRRWVTGALLMTRQGSAISVLFREFMTMAGLDNPVERRYYQIPCLVCVRHNQISNV